MVAYTDIIRKHAFDMYKEFDGEKFIVKDTVAMESYALGLVVSLMPADIDVVSVVSAFKAGLYAGVRQQLLLRQEKTY